MPSDLPERSPDLEWLLQSGEASTGTVAAVLVSEHYDAVFRLAYALTGDERTARSAAHKTLAAALLPNNRYRGESSVRAWLDSIAVRLCHPSHSVLRGRTSRQKPETVEFPATDSTWKAWETLDFPDRAAFALHAIHNLPASEIAQALGVAEQVVDGRLRRAYERLNTHIDPTGTAPQAELEARFVESLDRQIAGSGSDETDPETILAAVLALSAEMTRRQKRTESIRQASFGLAALVLVFFLVRFLNQSLPVSPFPAPALQTVMVTQLVPVTPSPTATPTPGPPLTVDSSPAEIMQRVNDSRHYWRTLWADGLIFNYGPAGYIGPPLTYRNQMWYQQPRSILVLGGRPDSAPDYIQSVSPDEGFEVSGGIPQQLDATRSPKTHKPVSIDPWLRPPFQTTVLPHGDFLSVMVHPYLVGNPDRDIRIIGAETVADREAVVVDWKAWNDVPSARLWVDAETGLILRMQSFKTGGDNVVMSETILTGLALDIPFPESFFRLKSSWFKNMSWGDQWQPVPVEEAWSQIQLSPPPPGRERLPRTAAPEGLDPSQNPLAFQWTTNPEHPFQPGPYTELFAGGYFLGRVEMGDPWALSCGRSPDGSILAFIQSPGAQVAPSQGIRYIRLDDPENVYDPLPNGKAGSQLTFSPDGKNMAFWGCEENGEACGLYTHDLTTHVSRMIIEIDNAWFFRWSPDSRLIDLFSYHVNGEQWMEIVADTQTGEIVYQTLFDAIKSSRPKDSPARAWRVEDTSAGPGLDRCISPP